MYISLQDKTSNAAKEEADYASLSSSVVLETVVKNTSRMFAGTLPQVVYGIATFPQPNSANVESEGHPNHWAASSVGTTRP